MENPISLCVFFFHTPTPALHVDELNNILTAYKRTVAYSFVVLH